MSYLNAYITEEPTWGWQGGPGFSTRITPLASGRESREALWARVRHSYTIPFKNLERAQYRQIKRMHLACRGQLHGFLFRDELDYSAEAEVFGYGDGTTREFQLCKVSAVDTVDYQRDCFAISRAVITVGNIVTPVVLDARRGKVTFEVPPANNAVLRWSGEFDVWVRFAQDDLPFSYDDIEAVSGSIDLIELPPPAVGDD